MPSGLVTFLFTDIEGSTRLAQLLGSGYRRVLNEHRRLLRRSFRADGGVELFTEGDSFFFAFPDAAAALRSCLTAQRALSTHPWPDQQAQPKVRMGLHSGWVQPQGGEYASPEVHRAARIAAAAHGGQVLCSTATAEAATAGATIATAEAASAAAGRSLPAGVRLRDLGLFRLRGFDGRERLYQLVAPGLPHSFPRPRTELAAPHNLPAPITSFVGRAQERQRLTDLLAEHRMVTVVGAGGSGKTRLAVEVAAGRVDSYPDGVWFVDLAAVTDPGLVVVTLAATLGLRPEPGRPVLDTLAEYVASRRLLLVLDTCDAQLAAVGAAVTALLAAGQGPRVLATSREPIGLPGELVWRIPPMSVREGPDGVPGDAVALLAARAAAARGGNPVAATELPHLTRIAARLDGLPLAIELAAARLRVLGTAQLAARLDAELDRGARDLLDTLDATGSTIRPDEPGAARHATLQAAVNWSYRTLEPQQARLLRALSVFADPVELATAQWLVADDPLAALTVLVEKSLLHTVPAQGGDPRADGQATGSDGYAYRMLDPIRAFAARQLVATGEEHGARERHVAWCLTALRTATVDAAGQPVTLSLYQLDKLAGEIRAALHWCVTRGTARAGLRLVCGLEQWWRERGLAREGRLWLFRLYGRMAETGERVDERVLADAYHVHSLQSGADGEHAEQLRYSHQAEAAARRVGDPGLLARVLATRCWALFDLGELDSAEQACRELIDWAGKQEVAADALFAVYCLALLLRRRGALDEAAELLAAARAAEASRPAVRGRRTADHLLGMVALARGDLVAAHDHLVVALRSRMTYGFHTRACDSLAAMAVRCAAGGDPRTAARLFGAVNAARARLRVPQGGFGDYWSRQEAQVRSALGDAAFDREYADGGGLTLDQAVQLALSVAQEDRDLPAELVDQLPVPPAS